MTLKIATAFSFVFCFLFSTAFAEDPIDTRIKDMLARKELESRNLAKAQTSLEEINKRVAERNELGRLKEEIKSYQTLITADQEDFESYQRQYKIEASAFAELQIIKSIQAKAVFRKAALGEKIESLTTTKGKTYEDAIISAITPFAINFRHSAGIASVPYKQLPPSYIKRFQFNDEEAEFSLKLEKVHRAKQETRNATERVIYNNATPKINVAFIERQIKTTRERLSYYARIQARNQAYVSRASYRSSSNLSFQRYREQITASEAAAKEAEMKVKQYKAEIKALEKKLKSSS